MGQTLFKKWGINGFTLKWIAMISMIIDHTGMVLFPQYRILRIVGRLAFPIYCFLLVEGAVHTLDIRKYLGRLFLFALISEIPYDLACSGQLWDFSSQNVFFTLFLGLSAIFVLQSQLNKAYCVVLVAALIFAAQYIHTDYGSFGVFVILLFYVFRERLFLKTAAFIVLDLFFYGGIQSYAVVSLIPILCYNGKRGPGMKYLFYLFYPVHLLVLYWLSTRL